MRTTPLFASRLMLIATGAVVSGCGGSGPTAAPDAGFAVPTSCQLAEGAAAPDFLQTLGCRGDFDTLASLPLDASIPGARSVKVVLDREGGDALYFQNSNKYKVHYQFAAAHLSGKGKPLVPTLSDFNRTEYYTPSRRFLLGAVTYYEGPKTWALEIAPYDTASAAMIAKLYRAVQRSAFFGRELVFHPTSVAVETEAKALPMDVRLKTTEALFAEIDYQPLNLGTSIGRLRFVSAAALHTEYVGFRDIVVLDRVPNDISVVSGLITEEFQTPLSHVNVLSQNRRTPNMGLRRAFSDQRLRALEGKWVRLTVGAFGYTVEEATSTEADAFWEKNKPAAVAVPRLDTSVKDLRPIEQVVTEGALPLRDAIKAAIPAFGGKAAHYSILARIEGVPVPRAFAIPVYHYVRFMQQNGIDKRVDELLADPRFRDDPKERDTQLAALRAAMKMAPVDEELQTMLKQRLADGFPGRIRYRSSTNAEDLEGFTGAGLYTSKTGDPADWNDVLDALRDVWASVWFFRAFEERTYRSIDHKAVGMALLCHRSFPDEAANGVALTANPFDPSGLEPGYYVNVQVGEESVVQPSAGVTTDQFLYHHDLPGQPIVYLSRSSLVPAGKSVLDREQVFALGKALDLLHKRYLPAYGPAPGAANPWFAMDVEFKFDAPTPGAKPELVIKQARPHPGRGM